MSYNNFTNVFMDLLGIKTKILFTILRGFSTQKFKKANRRATNKLQESFKKFEGKFEELKTIVFRIFFGGTFLKNSAFELLCN